MANGMSTAAADVAKADPSGGDSLPMNSAEAFAVARLWNPSSQLRFLPERVLVRGLAEPAL